MPKKRPPKQKSSTRFGSWLRFDAEYVCPLSRGYFFFFDLRLACARSDPATDRTSLLLLVRRSFEALEASRLLVVIALSLVNAQQPGSTLLIPPGHHAVLNGNPQSKSLGTDAPILPDLALHGFQDFRVHFGW